jgi:quaternary ammonium compound-resistance protein SugE
MAWTLLLGASLVEVLMAMALKQSHGWTHAGFGALGIAAALASIGLLTFAMRTLPVGTAYAVFTGLGAIGVALAGVVLYGESASASRILCIALIIAGVAGLKLLTR